MGRGGLHLRRVAPRKTARETWLRFVASHGDERARSLRGSDLVARCHKIRDNARSGTQSTCVDRKVGPWKERSTGTRSRDRSGQRILWHGATRSVTTREPRAPFLHHRSGRGNRPRKTAGAGRCPGSLLRNQGRVLGGREDQHAGDLLAKVAAEVLLKSAAFGRHAAAKRTLATRNTRSTPQTPGGL